MSAESSQPDGFLVEVLTRLDADETARRHPARRARDRGRRRPAAVGARRPCTCVTAVTSASGTCSSYGDGARRPAAPGRLRAPRRHRRRWPGPAPRSSSTPRGDDDGVGRRLVATARTETPDGRLRLWAHGENPAAVRSREEPGLSQGARAAAAATVAVGATAARRRCPPASPCAPSRRAPTTQAWVTLNALVFADHPEQGVADARRPAPTDGRALVRPGRVLPGRA